MAEEIASLYATIGADISGAIDGFNKVSKGFDNLGSQLKSAGASLTLGVTAPIVAFLGTSLKAASDAQTEIAQLDAVLKSTGGAAGVTKKEVIGLAESLQLTTRFSKDQTLAAEDMLLTFTNIKNDVFPQATRTVQNMSTALGQDMKTSAIQLGKALNDPLKGITALQRVGVTFTETQKEQIKAMMEAGNLAGAQKIILAELNKEFGGSAVGAGKTFAGAMDILNHKFQEFQEKVGTALMPILQDGMKIAGDFVEALMKIPTPLLDIGLKVVLVAAAVGPLVGLIGNLTSAVGLLMGAFFPIILPLTIVGGLFYLYQSNTLGFRDAVNRLGDALRALGPAGSIAVFALIPVGAALLKMAASALLTALPGVISSLAAAFWALSTPLFVILSPLILAGALFLAYQNNVLGFKTAIDKLGNSLRTTIAQLQQLIGLMTGHGIMGGTVGVGGTYTPDPSTYGFGSGSNSVDLLGAALGSHAAGGFVGSPQVSTLAENGPEYVVPRGGALVSGGGGGPQTIHLIADFGDAVQHFYFNVAQGIAKGNRMASGGA